MGAPTSKSKEVYDVHNAVNNPIHNPVNNPVNNPINGPIHGPVQRAKKKQQRKEEAIALLTENRHDTLQGGAGGGWISPSTSASPSRPSRWRHEFLGRRGANMTTKLDGTITRNRPVLLRGDRTLSEEKQHFTAEEAREELGFVCSLPYCSELRLNGYNMEDALQRKLHNLPLGRRLWREIAKGQKEKDTEPKPGVMYKVFITFSFSDIQAAIDASVCYVQK